MTVALLVAISLVNGCRSSTHDDAACTREKGYARADLATPARHPRPTLASCPSSDPDVATLRREWETKEASLDAREAAERDAGAGVRAANLASAAKVWAAYDALPAARRTKEALLNAVAEAAVFETGEDPRDREYIMRNNARAVRVRMAMFFNAKSKTTGEWDDTLIPSDNRAECLVWGSQWSKEAESLKSLGFKRLWCAPSSATRDAAREWTIE